MRDDNPFMELGRPSLARPRRTMRNLLGQAQTRASALRDEGAMVAVLIGHPSDIASRLRSEGRAVPEPFRGMAMVDTGASITAVERSVAERLGLVQTGVAPVAGVTGVAEQPIYAAALGFESPALTLDPWKMIGSPIGRQGFHLLIGRDVLARLKLVYDGATGSFSLQSTGGGGSTAARVAGTVLALGGVGAAIAFATGIIRV